jgi:hypothetical protein
MIAWLLVAALADDPLLVPMVADLDASLDRAETLMGTSRTHLGAMGEAQGEWVQAGCVSNACNWRVGRELVLQVRLSGHEARDAVQSVRMEVRRAREYALSYTVAPLLDETRRGRLQQVEVDADSLEREYQVRTAWYQQYMAGWAWRNRWALKDGALCVDDYRDEAE